MRKYVSLCYVVAFGILTFFFQVYFSMLFEARGQPLPEVPPHCLTWWGTLFSSRECDRAVSLRQSLENKRARDAEIIRKFQEAHEANIIQKAIPQPIEKYCPGKFGQECREDEVVASLFAVDDYSVIVIHRTYDLGEFRQCHDNKNWDKLKCKAIRTALSDSALKYHGNEARQVKVLVYGHSDLYPCTESFPRIWNRIREMCKQRRFEFEEDCLALARAYDMESLINAELVNKSDNRYVTYYDIDFDPFMATTNAYLKGALYRYLNLGDSVEKIKRELGIQQSWNSKEMRENSRKLLHSAPGISELLAPFRSVVIILESCKGTSIRCK